MAKREKIIDTFEKKVTEISLMRKIRTWWKTAEIKDQESVIELQEGLKATEKERLREGDEETTQRYILNKNKDEIFEHFLTFSLIS